MVSPVSDPVSVERSFVQATQNPQYFIRSFVLAVVFLLYLNTPSFSGEDNLEKALQSNHQKNLTRNAINRCYDKNDNLTFGFRRSNCPCTDPTEPLPQNRRKWREHYESLLRRNITIDEPDILFLGDSITERLTGSCFMGSLDMTDSQKAFEEVFPNGIAYGTATSSSPELLWQLQEGWLRQNETHSIATIFLLIGTNDLARQKCNEVSTLEGIWAITEYVQRVAPSSKVVVHGLLPRVDVETQKLGRLYKHIQRVNRELEKEASSRNYHYMEHSEMFSAAVGVMLADGIHPSVEGYKSWLPSIKDKLRKLG